MPPKKTAAGKTEYALEAPSVNPAVFLTDVDFKGFKQQSLPPIIKPREFPIGAAIHAVIKGVMASPIAEFPNDILQLEVIATKENVCFPVTSTVESALQKCPDAFIGNEIILKNNGQIRSRKDKKRKINNIEVWVKGDPANPEALKQARVPASVAAADKKAVRKG